MLRLQRTPLLNLLPLARNGARYPKTVIFGDVVSGLPVADGTADLVYCSHTLEHLSLEDCRIALRKTWQMLKPGGVFRAVLPDIKIICQEYLSASGKSPEAAHSFIRNTRMGVETTPRGLQRIRLMFSRDAHLWMWDYPSMAAELEAAGFIQVRRAQFGDSTHNDFAAVESQDRWDGALGFEARKPNL
jgi:ubiquinone/menaquinone biosynthesis C-methylase UbiE